MPDETNAAKWHRGSRFYRLGGHALYMAASFVYLAMYFHPDLVTAAFGVFGGTAGIHAGGPGCPSRTLHTKR